MKLRKPKVKVKKTSKPKPSTRIVTKVKRAGMPDIQLPKMSGMTDGFVGGFGGFELVPDLGEVSIFGGGQSIGNDFVGTFYDFKYDRRGRPRYMPGEKYEHDLKQFVRSGFKALELSQYKRSPQKLYTTHFMIPTLPSNLGPAAFGEDSLGARWSVVYRGQLVRKEGITFRFWGHGDNFLVVRVGGELVLNACWPGSDERVVPQWQSTSADSRKYRLGNNYSVVGDWITLEPGVPLGMEVLIGEFGGGGFAAMLLVEEQGVEYEKNSRGAPILPIFKTAELEPDVVDSIYSYLAEGEACITNGPVFCDYDSQGTSMGGDTTGSEGFSFQAEQFNSADATGMRSW
ncbi:MAG: hypothetical protein KAH99_03695, partial [Verrucomicrobia bacterium]|nr:hypothetical protein [Verrucomicrobiota bacterium]